MEVVYLVVSLKIIDIVESRCQGLYISLCGGREGADIW